MRIVTGFIFASTLLAADGSPFTGRWDFTLAARNGVGANWLGVTEKGGDNPEVWFQPTGGHVYKVTDFKLDGSHLTLNLEPATANHPALVWELDAGGGRLTGVQKRGEKTMALTGVRAPELKRGAPKAWTNPEPLFNGKNLDGWE